jgi:hypothetical protein
MLSRVARCVSDSGTEVATVRWGLFNCLLFLVFAWAALEESGSRTQPRRARVKTQRPDRNDEGQPIPTSVAAVEVCVSVSAITPPLECQKARQKQISAADLSGISNRRIPPAVREVPIFRTFFFVHVTSRRASPPCESRRSLATPDRGARPGTDSMSMGCCTLVAGGRACGVVRHCIFRLLLPARNGRSPSTTAALQPLHSPLRRPPRIALPTYGTGSSHCARYFAAAAAAAHDPAKEAPCSTSTSLPVPLAERDGKAIATAAQVLEWRLWAREHAHAAGMGQGLTLAPIAAQPDLTLPFPAQLKLALSPT